MLKYLPSWKEQCITCLPLICSQSSFTMEKQDNTPKSASRVNLDHFDPEGVRELSRTLSRSSAPPRVKSVRSDKTLASEEPFSLEKTLRAALDKYAHFCRISVNWLCLTAFVGNMIPISREENLVYTSRIFASPVLAQRRLTRQRLDPCSTQRPSGRNAKIN